MIRLLASPGLGSIAKHPMARARSPRRASSRRSRQVGRERLPSAASRATAAATAYNRESHTVPTREAFLSRFGYSAADLRKAGVTWNELQAIAERHVAGRDDLESTANYIASRLQAHPVVHSVKWRIKHPWHLLEKIVRKRLKGSKRTFDRDSYASAITDLIGVRVLHLFKGDWRSIDSFIRDSWRPVEKPTANIREGDPQAVVNAFVDAGCKVHRHQYGYRSVHYLVRSQPAKRPHIAELQVRTIFEEGWSEIDHRIRYPYNLENPVLNQLLALFNTLAGSADEMGSFIQVIQGLLTQGEADTEASTTRINELRAEVGRLKIDSKQRRQIDSGLQDLVLHPAPGPNPFKFIPSQDDGVLRPTMGALSQIGTMMFSPAHVAAVRTLGSTYPTLFTRCDQCGQLKALNETCATCHPFAGVLRSSTK